MLKIILIRNSIGMPFRIPSNAYREVISVILANVADQISGVPEAICWRVPVLTDGRI